MKLLGPALLLLAPALAAAATAGRISAGLDPRVELAGVMQALSPASSDPPGFLRPRSAYARKLESLSGAGGPVGQAPKALGFEERCQVLFRLGPVPDLAERLTMPYAYADRAGGVAAFARWLESMRGFARRAGFLARLREARPLIEPRLSAFRAKLGERDYVGEIEAYTGLPLAGTFTASLSPYVRGGDNANLVEALDDGTVEIASVFGPPAGAGDDADFWSARTPGTLWHEAGHAIEDPLADLYADRIDASSASYRASWGCYGDWRQCVKEEVVRAVMIRLMAKGFGDAAASEQLAFETETRFPHLRALVESLELYEGSRDRYPTLADYYPRLLDVLSAPSAAAPSIRSDCGPRGPRRRMGLFLDAVAARAKEPGVLAAVRSAKAANDAAEARCR